MERFTLLCGLALLAAAVPPTGAQTPADAPALQRLRQQRRDLAHQPRRVAANNDGCDVLYYPRDGAVSVDGFLEQRTKGLVGSQVDTIIYCSISSGFSNFTHHTKVGNVLVKQFGDYGINPDRKNITSDLIALGTDPLKAVVAFAHDQKLEAFWSMRMNDTHDVAHQPDKPYPLYPPLKLEHPDWLVGTVGQRTTGRWSSVDYGRPEIRDLAFRFIDEVCRNYDVDGIELDFFRHPTFFKSTANGGVASDAERQVMTDLLRRVRTMTEQVGLQRGRPLLVAIRTPDSVDYCRDLGLDLERWLADGLLDILITTCYFQLNPWRYSVELGHQYQVAVWPCLSDSRVTGETRRFRRASLESYRGRAANAWAAGADAIHLFNLFNPASPVFREIGDPRGLVGQDKLFFATVRDGNPDSFLAQGSRYRSLPLLAPGHPLAIAAGRPATIDVEVGEDFAGAAAAGLQPACTLHLETPRLARADQVAATVNGTALPTGQLDAGWLDLPVPANVLRQGANRVAVTLADAAGAADPWPLAWTGPAVPDPSRWTKDAGSKATVVEPVADGLLLADRGTASGDYVYFRHDWGADPQGQVVAEARVKVVSGSSYLIFGNGLIEDRLGLWPDRIELWTNTRQRWAMDTTNQFHTYRLEIQGRRVRVLVDGEVRLDVPETRLPASQASNRLSFGAANSPGQGEAIWAAVRGSASGQVVRDLLFSVRYPKQP